MKERSSKETNPRQKVVKELLTHVEFIRAKGTAEEAAEANQWELLLKKRHEEIAKAA